MYSTSTQKSQWTFTAEQLHERRKRANEKARASRLEFVQDEEQEMFLSVEEELLMTKIVERAALKFSDSFRPAMWNSVRWTAYMFYKRLYLDWSVMDVMPKVSIMACFYLAMKIDEFYVTIEEFVGNLTTGTGSQNANKILSMEPDIMRSLNYQLTVHCPFRPFEGHILEMKTKMLLNFDLETIRPAADDFFRMCLFGDAMIMYPPSQLSLAAIKYGLNCIQKPVDVLRQFIYKLMGIEDDFHGDVTDATNTAEKLITRLAEIEQNVITNGQDIDAHSQSSLLNRAKTLSELQVILDHRRATSGQERRPREEPVDSDDE